MAVPVDGHSLHIPVMGTCFSIDTPLKIAKLGLTSAISLVDDVLVEQMRKHHCEAESEPYTPITNADPDARANRITAYINLLNKLVSEQVAKLQAEEFTQGSDINRYFELLPDCPKRRIWEAMHAEKDPARKFDLQEQLRKLAVPGSIDANIMTKMDIDVYRGGIKQGAHETAAMSALRGFANSDGTSAIVFSAGFNPRMFKYAATFKDFFPVDGNAPRKRFVLKVSDYRSALIQGKYLAKLGLWVSEFRIESGLNCGGHAFPSKGLLLGPVLEEFTEKRGELYDTLWEMYRKALNDKEYALPDLQPTHRITAQGGITSAQENQELLDRYDIDGTGWGTPFMMVPEVIIIDERHLLKLARAGEDDVWLSDVSPLGVPFWTLRNSGSEEQKRRRIKNGKPGSPCPKRLIAADREFTVDPICTASREYLALKLADLKAQGILEEEYKDQEAKLLSKSCICHDLAGAATLKLGIDNNAAPCICCGPSIARFNRVYSLEEMVGHVYGRVDLLAGSSWPHMFIQELKLSAFVLRADVRRMSSTVSVARVKQLSEVRENLVNQIGYYQDQWSQAVDDRRKRLVAELGKIKTGLQNLPLKGVLARLTGPSK